MVIPVGPPAMLDGKPRQARKGATVVIDACAGVWLAGVATLDFPACIIRPLSYFARHDRVMSYQVLARRWRPQTFEQMVGQEHVLRALSNALERKRLHHAYLLTGTRGVGKTTLARLIARCLNCEQGISATPCGECSACREIAEGRFVDLLEVDAASRTKVEDTRDLLDNVQYAPARGRFKIYLIDEVHMLSAHSFNALLKTLEEPPEHVKFLLATTDPQKLPATVLSRCLQFHLKNLSPEQISAHLAQVLRAEQVEFEDSALWELALAAQGSMRDALSLADQAIAHGAGVLTLLSVTEMLGYVERALLRALVDALLAADAGLALAAIAEMAVHGTDFERALAELLTVLHRIALAQMVPATLDGAHGDRRQFERWAAMTTPQDVQLYYQVGLGCRRDLPLAPDARSGLEMALLRMLAFRPATAADARARTATESSLATMPPAAATHATMLPQEAGDPPKKPEPAAQRPARPAEIASGPAAMPVVPINPVLAAAVTATKIAAPVALAEATVPRRLQDVDVVNWPLLLEKLSLGGMPRSVAANSTPVSVCDDKLELTLARDHELLYQPQSDARLAEALAEYFGHPLRVVVHIGDCSAETPAGRDVRFRLERQQQAIAAIEDDANVQTLIQAFSARLHRDSIRPLEVAAAGEDNA